MLSPDPLRNPLGQHAPAAATAPSLADSSSTRRPGLRFAALLFGAAFVLCLVVYLALFVPGSWFPSAVSKTWLPRELALTRGSGSTEGDALAIKAPDASGLAVVSVTTDFRSSEYPAIAWTVADVPEDSDVRLLWNTDYAPNKVNSLPMTIVSGRLLPVTLAKNPQWIGRITGLALAIRGALPQPVTVKSVTARPMGAIEVLRDRAREWLAFESWNGTSINTITGGADIQDLPLPLVLALALPLALGAWYVVARRRGGVAVFPAAMALLFVIAWCVLDARWMWNLARQTVVTGTHYAGKTWRERHLEAEDGQLFAFIEAVRAKLPPPPARIFMIADADYFRGRGAYHLYPYNVYYDPWKDAVPPASLLHSGDFVVVYQRRGVQYDPSTQHLRWDGSEPIAADLLLTGPGAAAFRIR